MKLPKIRLDKQVNEFFARNMMLGVMLIVLSILYINNGFACERQIQRLDASRYELRKVEFQYYSVQKRFNSIGVRSNVKKKLSESGSTLGDSKKPNIKIPNE